MTHNLYFAAFLYLCVLVPAFTRWRVEAQDHAIRRRLALRKQLQSRRLEGTGDQLAAFNASGAPPTALAAAFAVSSDGKVQESSDEARG